MSTLSLAAKIEALLFVSGEPLTLIRLSKTTGSSVDEVKTALASLASRYSRDPQAGLMVIMNNGEAVLATKGEARDVVEGLTKSALQEHLSRPALEVLSIIAYRAPITRAEIELIRGVNCSFTLRNLLLRDLIEREGNPNDGRGYVYRPTMRLLQHLGLESTEALPDYTLLSQDERLSLHASEALPTTEDERL